MRTGRQRPGTGASVARTTAHGHDNQHVANVVNVFDPEVVVVGVGVSVAGELLLVSVRESACRFILAGVGTRTRVELARYGPQAGLRGAALLAGQELEREGFPLQAETKESRGMATQQVNVRLAALTAAGTSVWLDQIKRGLITTGELLRLVEGESLRGVTSDPTIFYQAILGSEDYDDQLAGAARAGMETRAIYQELAIRDIRDVCDVLRVVFEESGGMDGFVSFEVDPDLALDTDRTMQQAREYWDRVGRPNLLIKIPGTAEGAPAIEEMVYKGRNINVTLLLVSRSTRWSPRPIFVVWRDRKSVV